MKEGRGTSGRSNFARRWEVIGLLLTLAWAAIVVAFLFCGGTTCSTDVMRRIPSALNEVGDFLAGAFSPLAFIWLWISVMVQKDELRLQNEILVATLDELNLTRSVFAETKEETKKQRIATERRERGEIQDRLNFLLSRFANWCRNDLPKKVKLSSNPNKNYDLVENVPDHEQMFLSILSARLFVIESELRRALSEGLSAKCDLEKRQLFELSGWLSQVISIRSELEMGDLFEDTKDAVRAHDSAIWLANHSS